MNLSDLAKAAPSRPPGPGAPRRRLYDEIEETARQIMQSRPKWNLYQTVEFLLGKLEEAHREGRDDRAKTWLLPDPDEAAKARHAIHRSLRNRIYGRRRRRADVNHKSETHPTHTPA